MQSSLPAAGVLVSVAVNAWLFCHYVLAAVLKQTETLVSFVDGEGDPYIQRPGKRRPSFRSAAPISMGIIRQL